MKSYTYTIGDEYLGIPLMIEGELTTFSKTEPPMIIITDISYCGKSLELWCLSERFIKHCQDRIFQNWCNEVASWAAGVKNHA